MDNCRWALIDCGGGGCSSSSFSLHSPTLAITQLDSKIRSVNRLYDSFSSPLKVEDVSSRSSGTALFSDLGDDAVAGYQQQSQVLFSNSMEIFSPSIDRYLTPVLKSSEQEAASTLLQEIGKREAEQKGKGKRKVSGQWALLSQHAANEHKAESEAILKEKPLQNKTILRSRTSGKCGVSKATADKCTALKENFVKCAALATTAGKCASLKAAAGHENVELSKKRKITVRLLVRNKLSESSKKNNPIENITTQKHAPKKKSKAILKSEFNKQAKTLPKNEFKKQTKGLPKNEFNKQANALPKRELKEKTEFTSLNARNKADSKLDSDATHEILAVETKLQTRRSAIRKATVLVWALFEKNDYRVAKFVRTADYRQFTVSFCCGAKERIVSYDYLVAWKPSIGDTVLHCCKVARIAEIGLFCNVELIYCQAEGNTTEDDLQSSAESVTTSIAELSLDNFLFRKICGNLLFKGKYFLLTAAGDAEGCAVFDKEKASSLILQNGGTIIASTELSAVKLTARADSIILLGDAPKRTLKYIFATAFAFPKVHINWLWDCIKSDEFIPFDHYNLEKTERRNVGACLADLCFWLDTADVAFFQLWARIIQQLGGKLAEVQSDSCICLTKENIHLLVERIFSA